MALLIDNYDSFTYNLYQYLEELGEPTTVVRNDDMNAEELLGLQANMLIVSPGPSVPENAGVSVEAVRLFAGRVPILGVCLGLQCIAVAFGGKVGHAGEVVHGKTTNVTHDGKGVYKGLRQNFQAARYHSLAVIEESLPTELEVTACSKGGVIMGARHKNLTIEGVQFHPESIITPEGKDILANFLNMV